MKKLKIHLSKKGILALLFAVLLLPTFIIGAFAWYKNNVEIENPLKVSTGSVNASIESYIFDDDSSALIQCFDATITGANTVSSGTFNDIIPITKYGKNQTNDIYLYVTCNEGSTEIDVAVLLSVLDRYNQVISDADILQSFWYAYEDVTNYFNDTTGTNSERLTRIALDYNQRKEQVELSLQEDQYIVDQLYASHKYFDDLTSEMIMPSSLPMSVGDVRVIRFSFGSRTSELGIDFNLKFNFVAAQQGAINGNKSSSTHYVTNASELESAIAVCKPNDAIILQSNIALFTSLIINKPITLNLNGYTLSVNGSIKCIWSGGGEFVFNTQGDGRVVAYSNRSEGNFIIDAPNSTFTFKGSGNPVGGKGDIYISGRFEATIGYLGNGLYVNKAYIYDQFSTDINNLVQTNISFKTIHFNSGIYTVGYSTKVGTMITGQTVVNDVIQPIKIVNNGTITYTEWNDQWEWFDEKYYPPGTDPSIYAYTLEAYGGMDVCIDASTMVIQNEYYNADYPQLLIENNGSIEYVLLPILYNETSSPYGFIPYFNEDESTNNEASIRFKNSMKGHTYYVCSFGTHFVGPDGHDYTSRDVYDRVVESVGTSNYITPRYDEDDPTKVIFDINYTILESSGESTNLQTILDWYFKENGAGYDTNVKLDDETKHYLPTDVKYISITTYGDRVLSATDGAYLQKNYPNVLSIDLTNCECPSQTLPANCFKGYTKLEEVILPENLINIGNYAFQNTNVKEIYLPQSCTNSNTYSFTSVKYIHITNTTSGAVLPQLWASDTARIIFLPNQEVLDFYRTHSASNSASNNQSYWDNMYVEATWNKEENYFYRELTSDTICLVCIPYTLNSSLSFDFNQQIINDKLYKITEIDNYAFYNRMTKANFPTGYDLVANNLISVGDYAFYQCTGLKSFTANNCLEVGNYAFYMANGLETVTMNNCLEVGNYSFDANSQTSWTLRKVEMQNLLSVGDYAFRKQTAFDECDMLSIETVGTYAFQNTNAFPSFDHLQTVDKYAFTGDLGLTGNIVAPELTFIDNYGFQGCANIFTFVANELTDMQYYAFQNCTNLRTFKAPKWQIINLEPLNTNKYDNRQFNGCPNITMVESGIIWANNSYPRWFSVANPMEMWIYHQEYNAYNEKITIPYPISCTTGNNTVWTDQSKVHEYSIVLSGAASEITGVGLWDPESNITLSQYTQQSMHVKLDNISLKNIVSVDAPSEWQAIKKDLNTTGTGDPIYFDDIGYGDLIYAVDTNTNQAALLKVNLEYIGQVDFHVPNVVEFEGQTYPVTYISGFAGVQFNNASVTFGDNNLTVGGRGFSSAKGIQTLNLNRVNTIEGGYVFCNIDILECVYAPELVEVNWYGAFANCANLLVLNAPKLAHEGTNATQSATGSMNLIQGCSSLVVLETSFVACNANRGNGFFNSLTQCKLMTINPYNTNYAWDRSNTGATATAPENRGTAWAYYNNSSANNMDCYFNCLVSSSTNNDFSTNYYNMLNTQSASNTLNKIKFTDTEHWTTSDYIYNDIDTGSPVTRFNCGTELNPRYLSDLGYGDYVFAIDEQTDEATLLLCLLDSIDAGHYTIPATMTDKEGRSHPVTSIGQRAFYSVEIKDEVTLDIPEGIKEIGLEAFYHTTTFGPKSYTKVTIPSTMETLGSLCFGQNTTALTDIEINNDTTLIDATNIISNTGSYAPKNGLQVFIGAQAYSTIYTAARWGNLPKSVFQLVGNLYKPSANSPIFYYKDYDAGGIQIVYITDASGNTLTIPTQINGVDVTCLARGAFLNGTIKTSKSITKIILPDNLRTIGIYFQEDLYRDKFAEWEIADTNPYFYTDQYGILYEKNAKGQPETVLSCPPQCLGETQSLVVNGTTKNVAKCITIPETVTHFATYSFYYTRVSRINIPNLEIDGNPVDKQVTFSYSAFYSCTSSFTTLDLADHVTGYFDYGCFNSATYFTTLNLRGTDSTNLSKFVSFSPFISVSSNLKIYVPAEMISVYKQESFGLETLYTKFNELK